MSGVLPSPRTIAWMAAAGVVTVAVLLFEPFVVVRAAIAACCSISEQCSSTRYSPAPCRDTDRAVDRPDGLPHPEERSD